MSDMAQAPVDLTTVGEIYIDESSQTKHRFLTMGGLIVGGEYRAQLSHALSQARLPDLPNGEMAWTKVSRAKLGAYKRFVDVFFDNPLPDRLEFHSLTVDTHALNDKVFNDGSREIGFNKEIFQLCSKFARLYPNVPTFHVYADKRQSSQGLDELRLILNRGRKKKGDPRDWPFRRVHYRDGNDSQEIQLVDVLLGSIGFRLNGHDAAPNASPAKAELCTHIMDRAGIKNVFWDTATAGKFTIWHRRLR